VRAVPVLTRHKNAANRAPAVDLPRADLGREPNHRAAVRRRPLREELGAFHTPLEGREVRVQRGHAVHLVAPTSVLPVGHELSVQILPLVRRDAVGPQLLRVILRVIAHLAEHAARVGAPGAGQPSTAQARRSYSDARRNWLSTGAS
jgi:hypothetical protein